MSFTKLLIQNLKFHWRGNLAVFLGVVVGTTVLTGALLVGDSLRGSLRSLTKDQLGWVELALINKRFFRQELADKLQGEKLSPAIILKATTRGKKGNQSGTLLGVDDLFWPGQSTPVGSDYWSPPEDKIIDIFDRSVVLTPIVAKELGVKEGDTIPLTIERQATATPRESVLGRRKIKEVIATFDPPLKVKAILSPDHFGSRFRLEPGHTLPRNVYIPLRVLQEELTSQDREQNILPPRPINVILASGKEQAVLQKQLKEHMKLADWAMNLRKPRRRGFTPIPKYLSLESYEMFVPQAMQTAVEKSGLSHAATFVYLVNNISTLHRNFAALEAALCPPGPELSRAGIAIYGNNQVPYCVVAGLDLDREPPFGPILPKEMKKLGDDEILLVQYENSPLDHAKTGEQIALTFFEPDSEGQLSEVTHSFKLAAQVPLEGARVDPHLTPQYPGITNRLSLGEVDPPFPFDRSRIRLDPDEKYWRNYRTTPKAYLTLQTARHLWKSRFGDTTSIRIDPQGTSPEKVEEKIISQLNPEQGGLKFQEIRKQNLQSTSGNIDFGWYFLAFSFFLIAAALLLLGLLFQLSIDRRASEIGLLLAVGHQRWFVRRLLLAEGGILALLGGLLGCGIGIWYAGFLLDFLSARWPGGLDRSILQMHVSASSLTIGYLMAVLVCVLTIYWTTRILSKITPRSLLAGETTETAPVAQQGRLPISKWVSVGGLLGAVICFILGYTIEDQQTQAITFLGSGALLLTSGLAAIRLWMSRRDLNPVSRGGMYGLARLGIRNAGRHPVRSLLTMGLLASATFLVIALQAFHREPTAEFLQKEGGSGGFTILAETDVPVFQNLNNPELQEKIIDKVMKNKGLKDAFAAVEFYAFRVREGDNISCLNLYKPREPQIFGVPESIIRRGGFKFSGTLAETQAEKDNPWLLLQREAEAIPVFVEANTATYVLGSSLGGIIEVDSQGKKLKLQIVGLLKDSVFQGEMLMSEAKFHKAFPEVEGFNFFLIGGPSEQAQRVGSALEEYLADYGFVSTPTPKRLETFLAVENMYISAIQVLGGLGLMLGAIGLAVVLLRTTWERRAELALLRALGFRNRSLGWLVLAENSYLLVLGLFVGTAAALLAVAPHIGAASQVLWLQLIGLLLIVLMIGFLSEILALATTLRASVISALRKE